MGKGITKSDLCWVIVRFFGVIFLFDALVGLLGDFWNYRAVPVGARNAAFAVLIREIPWEVLKFFTGVYLLCAGGLIHWLLMYVAPENEGLEGENGNS